jgi:hypothetical protein
MDWACLLEKRGISLGGYIPIRLLQLAAFLLFRLFRLFQLFQLFRLFLLFQLFQLFQLILSGFEFSTCPSSLLLYII